MPGTPPQAAASSMPIPLALPLTSWRGSEYTLEEIIAAGIANCKRACAPYGALAALDVGPLGELLEPNGTLAFEDAVAEYGRIVRAGVVAGADLVFLETFTDLYELKAAMLAVKENQQPARAGQHEL